MMNDTYLYPYSSAEARERDELPLWRESHKANIACRNVIEDAIRQSFDGMHLDKNCLTPVLEVYGYPHGFGSNITAFTNVPASETAERAVENWRNSPGHFQTMINPDCDTIGVGISTDEGGTICFLFVGDPNAHNPYA